MSSITLSAIWVGSWKADSDEASILHSVVSKEASIHGLRESVTHLHASSNGLVQFMLMPCGSKDGYPTTSAWESLAAFTARSCAGTSFVVKRLYVASN